MESGRQLFLHTGTNLGDRTRNLARANEWIEAKIGTIIRTSQVYYTKPWGFTDQPDFLNQALEVKTELDPYAVLEKILEIERSMGRTRVIKWRERIIDIDILFYEDLIIDSPYLIIPHPHLHYRNFVLAPLQEIAPDLLHPVLGKTIAQLYADTRDPLEVAVEKGLS